MNPKLCGKPLKEECEGVTKRKRRKLILLVCVAVGGATLLALCCCGYIFSLLRWRKKLREGAAGEKKRSPAPSSGGEEAVGAGKIWTCIQGLFPRWHGPINPPPSRWSIEENTFRKEAESLGKVKHRNLTVLRGYYAGPPDVRLLVYDYMPNGNLATLLQEASHQDGHVLNWPMRHLIALGIARGLSFLHSVSMVHGDVKPQTSSLMRISKPISLISGYVSPEAALTGEATKEADVYSFGIVLLEILTAPDPLDRPSMSDIVFMLEGCRVGPDIPSSADPTSLPSPV
ncbi:putative LRR receptor-like serine/threonine-protein kinase [Vitis vinifera]|uniref:Putative LRR receptor-like serine/threonine-protein kinase n=1 Tax=Vitis vinifera TaxID=29760 RepID=A0A438K1A4_VITVI|nr:putative LRR receptor-like serine/threonine-protein kinase [Vitis vinifera]